MIRTDPLPGDIGLTVINGPIGRAIAFGEWLNGDGFGIYQRAFVVLGNHMLIEAEPGGARIRPITEYQRRDVLYLAPAGLTYRQRLDIVTAAAAYEGIPYSFADYAALAAHRLHLPTPGLRRYIASTGHMICSQLADTAYADAGVHLFADGRWPGYVTPMDLYTRLSPAADDVHPTEGTAGRP